MRKIKKKIHFITFLTALTLYIKLIYRICGEKMKVPCEIIMWYVLPAIRRDFAKIMMEEYGLNQKEVAAKLGITDAAVSQYLSAKRGKIKISDGKIQSEIRESAKKIVDGTESAMIKEICRICEILKSRGMIEKMIGR